MIDLAAIKGEITQLIQSHAPSGLVVIVYVFGSSGRSDFKDSSDIDLAFLVDERRHHEDAVKAISPIYMISARIGLILEREIDPFILNAASLEMAYEIITTGFCLFATDDGARLEYEIKIKGMYFDFYPFLSELRARKIAKIGSLETVG
jgi:predicted nucleotidyltransferase